MSEEMMDWQSIETAPVHRSVILCYRWKGTRHPFVAEGYLDWDKVTWRQQNGEEMRAELDSPTEWMPLPDPPHQ